MLRQHQTEGVEFLLKRNGGAIIGDEMGTGKTRLFLAYAKYQMHTRQASRTLVVVPASLVENWRREVKAYYGFEPCVYHGPKRELTPNWIYITSYETLRNDRNKLIAFFDKDIILGADEAHRIKNTEGRTFFHMDTFPSKYRIAMTGTPIGNRPEDVYALVRFVDPKLAGERGGWMADYCITEVAYVHAKNKKTGRQFTFQQVTVVGYKNLEELNSLLKVVMLRRTKKDCLDLPQKTVQYIPYAATDSLYQNVSNYLDMDDESILVKVIRLQQALSGLNPYDNLFKAGQKYRLLSELAAARSGRLIVWFKFETTLQYVADLLSEDHPVYVHTGKLTKEQKEKQLRDWKACDNGILLATIKSAGVGLTLTEAQAAIFYEQELSPADNQQAEDRIHRMGQENHCSIIYLYGEKTIEERIINLLDQKKRTNRAVVDLFTEDELKQIYEFSYKVEE